MSHMAVSLSDLYLEDETAWLDAMADRIQSGAIDELDYAHLQEYLTDMTRRDRREVKSRLVVLLTHILKWTAQTEHRSRSWLGSIIEQRQELAGDASKSVLRNHAEDVLGEAYAAAVERASAETGLATDAFPKDCAYNLDELLNFEPEQNE